MDVPIKERAAIVLYGIVGGMTWRDGYGKPTNIEDCADSLKYCIMSDYECDIFIHSWSIDHKEKLIDCLSPAAFSIQPQEYFGFNLSKNEMAFGDFPSPGSCFRAMSRWESTKRAIELKSEYERAQGFKYKYVMVPRIDLVYMNRINISKFDPNNVYICEEPVFCNNLFDPRFNTNCADDKLFLSSSDNINRFAEVVPDLKNGRYGFSAWNSHLITYDKIHDILGGDMSRLKFGLKTYYDVDVYRTAINFSEGREFARAHYCREHRIDMPSQVEKILRLARG